MRRLWFAGLAALLATGIAPRLAAQLRPPSGREFARAKDLAAGKLLVASRGLGDPNFARTVVLLVQYGDDGVVGLVINRRTKIGISEAFPELKAAKGRSDAVYLGGPVEQTGALALIRSRTKPKEAEAVFADLYLTASRALLEKTLASSSSVFHVYVGYAGWTAEQLQNEVEMGAWFIFPGDAAAVFDANPESVWSRWILKTEGQIALARGAPAIWSPVLVSTRVREAPAGLPARNLRR